MAVSRAEQIEVEYGEPIPLPQKRPYAAPIDTLAMANAVGVVTLAVYLVCAALAYTSIEILTGVGQLWFQGVAFTTAPLVFNPVGFAIGGFSITLLTWLVAATTTGLYNALRRS